MPRKYFVEMLLILETKYQLYPRDLSKGMTCSGQIFLRGIIHVSWFHCIVNCPN